MDLEMREVDELGFVITCGHVEERGKFDYIPLEHSADMAACKTCYIEHTPAEIVEEQGIDVPDGVEPGAKLLDADEMAEIADKLDDSSLNSGEQDE